MPLPKEERRVTLVRIVTELDRIKLDAERADAAGLALLIARAIEEARAQLFT